jgi:transcriptional regulator with XRE-family HTH domain
MPIDQNDITKIFVESVKNLIESGEVKTQQEIAEKIDLHRNALHLILKGERNVPAQKFKKFREIYMMQQNATKMEVVKDTPVDYKEKYIALLEKTVEDQDKANQALKRELEKMNNKIDAFERDVKASLAGYVEFAIEREAQLRTIQISLNEHRHKQEKVSLEKLAADTHKTFLSELERASKERNS